MIIVRLKGGMGNQMFQYATGLSLAKRHQTELKLDITLITDKVPDALSEYRDYALDAYCITSKMASSDEVLLYNPVARTFGERVYNRLKRFFSEPRVYFERDGLYDPGVLDLSDNTCIIGSFQSEKYFKEYKELLRKEFAVKEMPSERALQLGRLMRGSNTVSMHVRRGDYVHNAYFNKLIGAQPLGYYLSALELIRSKNTAIDRVYVFSDDVEWCRSNIPDDDKITLITNDLVESDQHTHLYLMQQCKHHIISNSTYSWWGAWLADTESPLVIAPAKWAVSNEAVTRSVVPDNWIKL